MPSHSDSPWLSAEAWGFIILVQLLRGSCVVIYLIQRPEYPNLVYAAYPTMTPYMTSSASPGYGLTSMISQLAIRVNTNPSEKLVFVLWLMGSDSGPLVISPLDISKKRRCPPSQSLLSHITAQWMTPLIRTPSG